MIIFEGKNDLHKPSFAANSFGEWMKWVFFFVEDIITEINLQQNHKNKSVSIEFSAANVAAVAKSIFVHLGHFLWASGGQRGTGM